MSTTERLQRLAQARPAHVHAWRFNPVVEARHAWRGVPCTVAVIRVSAIGERTRVDHPRELMKCLGLMPAESSSGAPRRPGAMTTAGNTHARRALVAGAWADRDPAKVSRHLQRRLAQPPKSIQAISWKAQVRRCQRDRRLVCRGQHLRSRACSSPRACGWGFLQTPPRDDALALLLAFGSANTWHEDFHLARSVPCPAHTPGMSRAVQRVRSSGWLGGACMASRGL